MVTRTRCSPHSLVYSKNNENRSVFSSPDERDLRVTRNSCDCRLCAPKTPKFSLLHVHSSRIRLTGKKKYKSFFQTKTQSNRQPRRKRINVDNRTDRCVNTELYFLYWWAFSERSRFELSTGPLIIPVV